MTHKKRHNFYKLRINNHGNAAKIEIKDLRKKFGLSQGEISKVAGISHSMVTMIEQGKRPMSTEIIRKVGQLK